MYHFDIFFNVGSFSSLARCSHPWCQIINSNKTFPSRKCMKKFINSIKGSFNRSCNQEQNNDFNLMAAFLLVSSFIKRFLTLFYMGFWKYVITWGGIKTIPPYWNPLKWFKLGKKACFGKNWLLLPIIYAFGVELLPFLTPKTTKNRCIFKCIEGPPSSRKRYFLRVLFRVNNGNDSTPNA